MVWKGASPPAPESRQNRPELDTQQGLQVFPENGLFLLLGNAFQPQYPGNGSVKVHVEGPIGAEDFMASPTASDTAKHFAPDGLEKAPEAGFWFDAPPGRCYTRPYLIAISKRPMSFRKSETTEESKSWARKTS